MKKNLLTLGMLVGAAALHAQVLTHVDQAGLVYVGKDALVYNGGGLQTKGTGKIENHGDIMIEGASTDVVKTIDASNAVIPLATGGQNIVNVINEPGKYDTWNANTGVPEFTYGQILIKGISQDNITGIVSQEYRNPKHGSYQQIAIPFFAKNAASLGTDLGKSFSTVRRSENEILVWNNARAVFDHLTNLNTDLGAGYVFGKNSTNTIKPYSYYSLGSKNLDASAAVKLLKGRPVSDQSESEYKVTLKGAGAGINYGTNGNAVNEYGGKYNTYLGDLWAYQRQNRWDGIDYGKNIYQLGNPFLTNLDLSTILDQVPNLYGIKFEPSDVVFKANGGTTTGSVKYVTVDSGVLVGDTKYMMVRPYGTFVLKLNNTTEAELDLSKLRSLDYHTGSSVGALSAGASKMVAGKSVSNIGTVKQLAVIGLNASGGEVARTYYVVSNNAITGANTVNHTQVTHFGGSLGTYEEDRNGGYDVDAQSKYWLYINSANERDFLGKNVKLVNYDTAITQFKFEISENGASVEDGVHQLSAGEGFYIKGTDGKLVDIKSNNTIAATGKSTGQEFDLYYGLPAKEEGTLGTDTSKVASRTFVVYNPNISDYIVRFDPTWKKADITVYDMSGKLVSSAKAVNASSDYVINLGKQTTKGTYIVNAVSDSGVVVQSKIIKE